MQDVIARMSESLEAGRPFAYCRLVETRGSTPQKAGARMLVYPDGAQAGTLGGGCVEADVKRNALVALADDMPRIDTFHLDDDYGWDDGLICGGRVTILVRPVQPGSEAAAYYRRLCECERRGHVIEVIAFDRDACGLPDGGCYLLDAARKVVGQLAVPTDIPPAIRDRLRSLGQRPRSCTAAGAAFLPTLPRCRLVIVGGGHIGKAVADLAATLEFDVWAIDDRSEFVRAERFPNAQRRIAGDLDQILPNLEITPDTYCLIVTRGHNHDERALFHLAQRGAGYVGMIGSRRKIRLIYEDLIQEGIPAESLNHVYAPLGIDIGSQSVAEIAVSICAELVAHRNLGGQVPGRPRGVRVEDQHDAR